MTIMIKKRTCYSCFLDDDYDEDDERVRIKLM